MSAYNHSHAVHQLSDPGVAQMSSTVRLGRVAGIEIGAHWSWLLVVGLIVWSLADGVFPVTNPGLSDGAYVAMAAVAAVLFFGSIVLHELGHSIQAQREGVAIDGITLWVFGGVARLRGQLPSAGAELRMAIAGPVVSLVLGIAFLFAAIVLPLPASVDGVAFWLGQINLYLLVFNMLPALPLDGGRVLRALLWARRGDFISATRTSGALGRGFGQLLIALGVVLVIFVGDFGGVWLAFLGWFLLGAAEAELQVATLRDQLGGMTVSQLMVRDPVTVGAETSLQNFLDQVFLPTRHTAYPVMDGGSPAGIVSFRDALEVPRAQWPTTSVRGIMSSGPRVVVHPDARLSDVLPALTADDLRRRLVSRDGGLEGLLSLTDVARVLEVLMASPDGVPVKQPGFGRTTPKGENLWQPASNRSARSSRSRTPYTT
jgi:Zn-dependent protease/CBS domain-containing protein